MVQIIRLPHDNFELLLVDHTDQQSAVSALTDLNHVVGIYHTDHLPIVELLLWPRLNFFSVKYGVSDAIITCLLYTSPSPRD